MSLKTLDNTPTITLPTPKPRVLITGATGFIGRHLVRSLQGNCSNITVLTRNATRAQKILGGDLRCIETLDAIASSPFDIVINLAGESLAEGRWNTKKKQRCIASRVDTTNALMRFIEQQSYKPSLLINGSAVGYYGTDICDEVDESYQPRIADYPQMLCHQWEQAAAEASNFGLRVVMLRIGVVLGEGGALAKMYPPFRLGLGGVIGSGEQWVSWIHMHDLMACIDHIIRDDSIVGPFNATAPAPITNRALTEALSKVLKRPARLPMPALMARVLFGEMANDLLLKGQRVLPAKAVDCGIDFQYPTITSALSHIIRV